MAGMTGKKQTRETEPASRPLRNRQLAGKPIYRLSPNRKDAGRDSEQMAKQEQHHEKTRHEKQTVVQTGRLPGRGGNAAVPSCSGNRNCDRLCGSWSSVEGKPDVLIYKEGDAYKVEVFSPKRQDEKLKPETYLLVEEDGNLFINTGYRIDVAYNEAADILTFSPNGDYVRKEVKP